MCAAEFRNSRSLSPGKGYGRCPLLQRSLFQCTYSGSKSSSMPPPKETTGLCRNVPIGMSACIISSFALGSVNWLAGKGAPQLPVFASEVAPDFSVGYQWVSAVQDWTNGKTGVTGTLILLLLWRITAFHKKSHLDFLLGVLTLLA